MIFLESPWPILLLGIAIEAVLAVMLLRTGQGKLLWAMIGAALLVLAGLVVEHLVVTEREAVEDRLDAAAAAVQANDLAGLLAYISTSAPKTQNDARYILGLVEFSKARLSGIEIAVNRLTSPPTAKAKFTAVGAARYRKSTDFSGNFARQVTANLRKENDRWMIGDYTVEDFPLPR